MKQINYTAIFWVLTIVAMLGGVALVSQSQDTRRGAAFSSGRLLLLPNDNISFTVGQTQNVQLHVNSGADIAKVDAVRTNICFNKNYVALNDSVVENNIKNLDSAFETVIASLRNGTDPNTQCLDLTILAKDKKASKAGQFRIADITFKGVAAGSGPISIDKDKTEVSGDNPGNSDKVISIDSVAGTQYSVTGQPVTSSCNTSNGNCAAIQFKMAFAGVKHGAACNNGVNLKVIAVHGVGDTYILGSVGSLEADGDKVNSKGDQIYKLTSPITYNSDYTDQLSVFIKGNRHIQMKYGQNNQKENYKAAVGAVSITRDSSTTPMLDFSEVPNLPGDINQDGKINAIDYSILKDNSHKTVSAGQFITADLNGDCQVNGIDTLLFISSLQDKQDQLY